MRVCLIYAKAGESTMSITIEQIAAGEKRMQKQRAEYGADGAYYDRNTGRVVVSFPTGVQVSFDPRKAQGLERATPEQLGVIELSPSGLGLHFPEVDGDISIPALMHNVLGSEAWMAQIGKMGGAIRSERKSEAARENGKLGGRPKAN
jgi:hypothetical protein